MKIKNKVKIYDTPNIKKGLHNVWADQLIVKDAEDFLADREAELKQERQLEDKLNK